VVLPLTAMEVVECPAPVSNTGFQSQLVELHVVLHPLAWLSQT
jgi:hypothetical protein